MINLHLHTNASDGELSPEQLVNLAINKGLKVIAITDHDTVEGVNIASEYIKRKNLNIELVPGIEFNCDEKKLGFADVHVIGLFIDSKSRKLLSLTNRIKQDRIKQNEEIIKKLNEFSFDISFEEISNPVKGYFDRTHIARILLKKYPKKFSSVKDVFDKYIGTGKSAYVERKFKIGMKDAIETIRKCGGISFLAHPGVYSNKDAMELINFFIKHNGEGIETYYPYDIINNISKKESIEKNKFFRSIAKKRNLLETGGTDFHGGIRGNIESIEINFDILNNIYKRL